VRDRLPGEVGRQLLEQVVQRAQRSGPRLAVRRPVAARRLGGACATTKSTACPTVVMRAACSSDIVTP
jgi:hypothetical protein